ncbi:hypothetical protein GCM10022403_085650 [Streptomyces coacervatus]|uniref:Uncharacterized protein n=1 Tax=Streptomyces coacervatus TaxID=647381 RepID=A0ABP7JB94_9ACTN
MGAHRHDGNHIATELEILCKGMGLPVADTDDRARAVGVLIASGGTRVASLCLRGNAENITAGSI